MRRDTIFRITSMTKPVVAAAVMILVDEGVLRLDEPVEGLLPELGGRRVLARPDGPLDDTVPARRPITVADLLTFRWGFGLDPELPPTTPIMQEARELGLAVGPPLPPTPHPPDEWLRRLGTLPLLYQPGERWLYDTGSDVLAVLVARASGQPLETFLAARILSPSSVRLMTSDQLTPAQHGSPLLGDRDWGLGLAVAATGRYGWDGGVGTSWFTDPAQRTVAVLLTQRVFSAPFMAVLEDFWATGDGRDPVTG